MDKRAQKRKMLDKLREKVDIFGHAAEEFSPTFGKLMLQLRNTDTMIRDSLLEQDPSLKDVLKNAKSNFNKREYMASISDLKAFHDKVENVVKVLKNLQNNVDEAHEEFLFGGLPNETLTGLKSLKDRFEATKAARQNEIVKEAGLSDLWYALTSERGKAIRAWEKRYPGKMKQVKTQTNSLLKKSEGLFSQLLASLKEMSSARAARNIDRYVKAAEKLTAKFDDYNKDFKSFYETNVKGFLEKLIAREAEKAQKEEEGKQVKTEETGVGEQEIAPPTVREPAGKVFEGDPLENFMAPSARPQIPLNDEVEESEKYFIPSVRAPISDPSSQVDPVGPTMPSPRVEFVAPEGPLTPIPPGVRTPPHSSGTRSIKPPSVDLVNPSIPKPPRVPQDIVTPSVQKQLDQGANTVRPGAKHAPDTVPHAQWEGGAPATERDPQVGPGTLRSAHPLLKTLQVLSSESPEVLALEISKYAASIQKTDPKQSAKLFAIVENILNGK